MSAKAIRRGVFLIGIGLVLLFNNLALLDWEVWYDLLRFWPVILICFGLERLFRESRLRALGYLSPLVLALTFVGVVYYQGFSNEAEDFEPWGHEAELHRWTVDDEGPYSKVKLDLDFAVGSLWLEAGQEALLAARFDYHRKPPRCSYDVDDSVACIRIRSEPNRASVFSKRDRNHAKIQVSDRYPLELRLDLGACSVDMDLSDFELVELKVDGGLCDIDLRLGDRSEHLTADIEVGVSDLEVEIPEGVGLKLSKDTALSSFNHRGIRIEKRSGSTYVSEDYSTAEKKIDLHLDAGLSSLTIRRP